MSTPSKPARILIVAGSDSGGGAGIQADIKTVTALGGFAMTAVTALTAQNTQGVFGIHEVPTDFINQQISLVAEDIGVDAVKTGMLHNTAVIDTVVSALQQYCPKAAIVVDPVMMAEAGAALKNKLLKLATVLTPNLPEAEALVGFPVQNEKDMRQAGTALLAFGPKAVLVKGGHLTGERIIDVLVTAAGVLRFEDRRIDTAHTHGTGCTLASAIATGIGQGLTIEASVRRARAYVMEAIRTAPGFGRGHGPQRITHREGDAVRVRHEPCHASQVLVRLFLRLQHGVPYRNICEVAALALRIAIAPCVITRLAIKRYQSKTFETNPRVLRSARRQGRNP